MFYVLCQGLDSVKELDYIEAKEKRKAIEAKAAGSAVTTIVNLAKGID